MILNSLCEFAARMLTVVTPPAYSFLKTAWFIVHQPFFTFQVRACADARILLLEDPVDVSLYSREVILGGVGNTKVMIYDSRNATLAEQDARGLLSCNELQQFWISWNLQSMMLSIGRGTVGSEQILQYADNAMRPIHVVSVSTVNGIDGEWQFSRDAGKLVYSANRFILNFHSLFTGIILRFVRYQVLGLAFL
jgi:Farnesoic acid 0-methyl transferase